MAKILVIDDQRSIRNTLKDILEYEGHTVGLADDGVIGLDMFKAEQYDVVLTDIKMPNMDGMEVLQNIIDIKRDVPIIMISGHGNIDTAVEAIKKGAYDFIEKPLDLNRLLITIRNAMDKSNLVSEAKILRKKVNSKYSIVGASKAIEKIFDMTNKVAPTDARVL